MPADGGLLPTPSDQSDPPWFGNLHSAMRRHAHVGHAWTEARSVVGVLDAGQAGQPSYARGAEEAVRQAWPGSLPPFAYAPHHVIITCCDYGAVGGFGHQRGSRFDGGGQEGEQGE